MRRAFVVLIDVAAGSARIVDVPCAISRARAWPDLARRVWKIIWVAIHRQAWHAHARASRNPH